MSHDPTILYCHCAYAQVVDKELKKTVLSHLCASGKPFEAVADLCEMSARRDPALKRLASAPGCQVVACYPRAVKWLFAAAGAPLDPETTQVLNMRSRTAPEIIASLEGAPQGENLPLEEPVQT